jgi:hypothetical protein
MQVVSSFVYLIIYDTTVKTELKMDIIWVRLIILKFLYYARLLILKFLYYIRLCDMI